MALAGCKTGSTNSTATIKQLNDPESLRQSGAKETTLGAFCNAPPRAQTEAGTSAIKSTCSPHNLRLLSDASVFDKGDGVYAVFFKRPVTQAEFCGGPSKPRTCSMLYAGDTLNSMRFTAR